MIQQASIPGCRNQSPPRASDPRLLRYVERVRSLCSDGLSPRTLVQRVSDAMGELVAAPVQIGPELRAMPARGYGRNLVYRDQEHGFVVIAVAWPPRTGGAPHDHGTWGVVGVLEGSVQVTHFEREDDGSRPGRASLRDLGTVEAGRGTVTHVLPPHWDCHRMSNPSDQPALTLHTYGRELLRCNLFDPATGKIDVVEPSYAAV